MIKERNVVKTAKNLYEGRELSMLLRANYFR